MFGFSVCAVNEEISVDALNRFNVLCVVAALFISGCGKKKTEKVQGRESDVKESSKALAMADIPILKDEVEDLFDDEEIADFAFIDDEDESFGDIQQEFDTIEQEDAVAVAQNEDIVMEDNLAIDELLEDEESDIASPFSFKTVQFDLNKNNIREDQKNAVEEDILVAQDAISQGKQVVIEGHCCQTGSAGYNLVLSQRRAEAVKSEMVKHGLDADNLKTIGYGYERPIVWSDAQDRTELVKELAPNRRAEVLVN